MQCPKCDAENREGRLYCAECGAAIGVSCPECGAANERGDRFCGACGADLALAAADESPSPAARDPDDDAGAERRQLTVMFCDLVGSTALSERIDPEELREVFGAYREACSRVIRRFEGHIHSYVGDGILAYFGYPQAHEDDAQRAVRAGLGIAREMGPLNDRVPIAGGTLAVRIGINTGLVVAGDIGTDTMREQRAVVGETPNVAARLLVLAEPNSVVISASTQRLVEGLFVFEALGEQPIKGVSEPMPVFRVAAEGDAHSRFEASIDRGLTPLVGRAEEIELLIKRWQQAREGEEQIVLISGEAGIGKSRILRRVQRRLGDQMGIRVLYYCSPYHQNSALFPVIDQLERGLHFEKSDAAGVKLDKLEVALRDLQLSVDAVAPILASLLSLPTGERYPPLDLNPQQLRKKTLETVLAMIDTASKRDPVLMIVEDAQWIDPTTLELLGLIIAQLRISRILLLITFRPEFRPPWGDYEHVTALKLNRLSKAESMALIPEITGGKDLPPEVLAKIVAMTDGVPLFVEELTKTVLESDLLEDVGDCYVLHGPLPPLAIPASLHDSLTARLDRLLPVKRVAQMAATLGRAFGEDMLAAVSGLPREELQSALVELVGAGLIYKRGLHPDVSYAFKHALVRDAAYHSLLKSTRQQYHRRIALALEETFPQTMETQPELMAHHYTEADLTEQAIEYWERAGHRASESSANQEAIAHLSKGLELVRTLPQVPGNLQKELDMRIALNGPLIAAKGYSAPELERNFTRALEICRQIGENQKIFPVMYAKWVFHITTGELTKGHQLAEEFLHLAEEQQNDVAEMIGHRLLGPASFIVGDFLAARQHLEQAIAPYRAEQHGALTVVYGQDVKAACLCYLALTLWHLGYPEQAFERGRQALEQADAIRHTHTKGNALGHAGAFLRLLCRRAKSAQEQANKVLAFAAEYELPVWAAVGRFYLGWALMQQGRMAEGIESMRDGLAELRAIGFVYWQPLVLACLADAYGQEGNRERALDALDEAQALMEKGGERWFEAELHRIRGELWAAAPARLSDAETCLQQAIEIARRQSARSLELRAATRLGRLWHAKGKATEARTLLEPVYGWFTEGFDTPDLMDAKALLDELS